MKFIKQSSEQYTQPEEDETTQSLSEENLVLEKETRKGVMRTIQKMTLE